MLTEVVFMGVREARALEPRQDTVIISILDQFEEHNRPDRLHLFRDHLILNFVDITEKPDETPWPDEMTPEQHKAVCTWDEDRAPELGDAQRIVAFVEKHHRDPNDLHLVVHCHGGVSRSAAVAQWVSEAYVVSLLRPEEGGRSLEGANSRVLRLLRRAAIRR